MSNQPDQLPQDQGVLEAPVRGLESEDEDATLDELAQAALELGVAPDSITEADGVPTELG